ncbi:F-box domain containing protein [Pandoravirus quercus]|uniref:F-box domain containing protein n=1 Tax=Pandoravirus quercus TaxID=2107709 RepID=A0A2U7U9B2_9VIRU|nr:F-box domain containing protein [Pandoravirus quercus]AVK74982.1 F-box domain containing protein [Pandoravirus quercus]
MRTADSDIPTHRQKRQRRAAIGWDDLADEILLHVASFLDIASVASLGCVDHRTRLVCLDDRLWRRFYKEQVACTVSLEQTAAHNKTIACARAWLADPTDASEPLRAWNRVLADGLHIGVTRLDTEDHRWAYAVHLAPLGRSRCFARWPDVPPCAVAKIHDFVLSPFAISTSELPPMTTRKGSGMRTTYLGGIVLGDRPQPHGRGESVTVKDSGAGVVCRIIGEWERGMPNGRVRVWAAKYGGTEYYEGDCLRGRAHGHGLLITPHGAYEGQWADGFLRWPAIKRIFARHIVHRAPNPDHRGSLLPSIVNRSDGSVAFKGLCDKSGSADKGLLFGPSGVVVYDGKVLDCYRALGRGTVYLDDGTTISGDFGSSDPLLDICVTYPNGDMIHCRRPRSIDANGWIPEVITRFTFSSSSTTTAVDPALAGRTIDGPWHILAVGPRNKEPPPGHAFPYEPRQWRGRPPVMTVTEIRDYMPTSERDVGPLDKTRVAAVRTLDAFVFWPRSAGLDERQRLDRERFFDHMVAHHGPQWAVCRRIATATPW